MDIESTGEEQELVIAISCSLIWEWNTRAAEKLEGVSKKQLRRGMATSSSSLHRFPAFTGLSAEFISQNSHIFWDIQLLSPQDFSTPPPGTPLSPVPAPCIPAVPAPLSPATPGCHPPAGRGVHGGWSFSQS